ncbi:MAG: PH domain-containing protein [Planctomycetota bacterium]
MSNRYIVHCRDPRTMVEQQKVFEAESGAEARSMAEALSLEVLAVEVPSVEIPSVEGLAPETPRHVAASSPQEPSNPLSDPAADEDPEKRPETESWQASPSQWINTGWFLLCLLVIPIPYAVWRAITTATTDYSLTTQRIQFREGVFNRTLEEIELYRVKDTTHGATLLQRIFGVGTVIVESSDATMPRLVIPWVRDAQGVREKIRSNVEAVRRARGVRELDVS